MAQPNWITPAGIVAKTIYPIGTIASNKPYILQLEAVPVVPSTSVTYRVISGTLPAGLSLTLSGLLYGTPALVNELTSYTFVVRATDNYSNVRDRTFQLNVSGSKIPSFITGPGEIIDTIDSVWISYQLIIDNPDPNNIFTIRVLEGILPPGLEIDNSGLIRGYPDQPLIDVSFPEVSAQTTSTTNSNILTCLSTTGFIIGRPIMFTGVDIFGNIEKDVTYYVKSIISSTQYTISSTQNGPTFELVDGSGLMTTILPATTIGQPTIKTYSFTLKLESSLGTALSNYSIVVRNQNLPVSMGGIGSPPNSRIPAIFNTKPETFDLSDNNIYYGYYVIPPSNSTYNTYPIDVLAPIGKFTADNYLAFKVIGHDFDADELTYAFSNIPLGLVGDSETGWITGYPVISAKDYIQIAFSVYVFKTNNPTLQSETINFSLIITNQIAGNIVWVTDSDLGSIDNGTISLKNVRAYSDVPLEYRLVGSTNLPPNLTLLSNGEITGYVAYQPSSTLLANGTVTDFSFTIEAFSPTYNLIRSQKIFTMSVNQTYAKPTDTLYIKATPSLADRALLKTLLQGELSDTMMPEDYLYRPNDIYFGKASDVIYEHAYGIYASNLDQYIAAITKNHYWRNITLGELKTALAKDENGVIVYEVVYSQIIDNLVNMQGVSISEDIYWPRNINLFEGPWYASITDIYTSYVDILGQQYYTSLSPGYVRELYPNSLANMRTRVAQNLGQEPSTNILPLWMTSQQSNGSTLGYTQAWVICYTKPGYSETIKNNINNLWVKPDGTPYKLNQINFQIDRFAVDKTMTYNFDTTVTPGAYTAFPSATPVPDPLDSKDFYVLFPRKTILPRQNQ